MKRSFVMLGLPIVAGIGLTLASCENPAAEREESDLQQPGAVPTNVDNAEDDDDEAAPNQGVNDQDDDDENEND